MLGRIERGATGDVIGRAWCFSRRIDAIAFARRKGIRPSATTQNDICEALALLDAEVSQKP